jgi:protein KRI1
MEKESEERHYTLPSIPRHVEDSVRKKDNKRKRERERKKETKEFEQTRKLEEVKKLKSLAKKEAIEKFKEVEKIGEVFSRENEKGNAVRQIMQFISKGDWKEEEYDQMMSQLYNDEFYGDEEMNAEEVEQMQQEELGELIAEVKNPNNPSKSKTSSKSAEAVSLEQTREILSDLRYSMQELNEQQSQAYASIPFRYRNVQADTFGLSIEDILNMEDRDLNKHISLKKLAPYLSGYDDNSENGETEARWQGQWRGKESWEQMRTTNPLPASKRYAQVYKVQQQQKRQREEETKKKLAAIVPLESKPIETLSATQKRRLRAKKKLKAAETSNAS